jgi:hypothetical protein
MDDEELKIFKVHQAPSAKFYVTRQEQALCTRTGALLYFETDIEFLRQHGGQE